MRFYKFPKWLKGFYQGAVWDFYLKSTEKTIYLTFDDGPNNISTPWLINELKKEKVKATFFCLGKNLQSNSNLHTSYLINGHKVANHGTNHLNGYITSTKKYVNDVENCNTFLKSKLFRPPYGKCTPKQHKILKKLGYKTVFWSHITYDFDKNLSSNIRIKMFKKNLKSGGIIVFHDSVKALPQLKKDLPLILNFLKQNGYKFKVLPE